MNLKIQDLIAEEITKERKTHEIRSWTASKLGSCLTGVYLERLGIKPDTDFDERTLRVFSVGKMMEEWLIDKIVKNNSDLKVETQGRVENKELNVSGYWDLMIEQSGKKTLYEIKSKHSKSFWWMEKKKEGASLQHKMQLWLYLYLTGIEDGHLIYLSKDDLAILEYPIKKSDKELEKSVMNEIDILNRSWKEKLPPVPPSEDDWRSKYCRWHNQCKKQEKYLSSLQ